MFFLPIGMRDEVPESNTPNTRDPGVSPDRRAAARARGIVRRAA
jgi:hypothetical protein